jgi:hypothetical protein
MGKTFLIETHMIRAKCAKQSDLHLLSAFVLPITNQTKINDHRNFVANDGLMDGWSEYTTNETLEIRSNDSSKDTNFSRNLLSEVL